MIGTDCRMFARFSCSPTVAMHHRPKKACAPFANRRCRDSNNLVVITSFLNSLTLRRERCRDSSCESSFEVKESRTRSEVSTIRGSGWVGLTGAQSSRLQRRFNEAYASEDACAPVINPRATGGGTDFSPRQGKPQ